MRFRDVWQVGLLLVASSGADARPALAGGAAPAAANGEKYALVVGVREYDPNELRILPFAEPDAGGLAAALRGAGYRRVVLMTQSEGARRARALPLARNIRAELKGMLEDRDADDSVVVALIGHGVQFRGSRASFFCPMDARLADPSTLIALDDVYRALEESAAGVKLLVVDACRNDPLSDNSRSRAVVHLESVTRPQAALPPGGVAAFFSCSEGEKSYEDAGIGHGVFSHFLIKGLKGEADLDRDGAVELEELARFAKKRVPDFVKDLYGPEVRQMPVLRGEVRGLPVLANVSKAPRSRDLRLEGIAAGMPIVAIETNYGEITLVLDRAKAPITVENFLGYVDADHYGDTLFHRVIPGFMIQGGGYDRSTRRQKPERPPIKNESHNGLSNTRGTIAIARAADPASARSQFFINLVDNSSLDTLGGGYAVFGKVLDGMDVVDAIAKVRTARANLEQSSDGTSYHPVMNEDVPTEPVVVIRITVIRITRKGR